MVTLLWIALLLGGIDRAQGKVITDKMFSPSLEGNLMKTSPTKYMNIYLPPGYDEGDTRYPVIYYLHGSGQSHTMWVQGFNIHNVMNSLIKQGKAQEAIIVMPNASGSGSYLTNSSVAGNYEDYVTQELVEFIDSNYRTLPQRESRGIGGGSRGGYGAMNFAIKHPDVYCAVVSHSGKLSFDLQMDDIRLNPNDDFYKNMATAFSPNPDSPLLYDYPADDEGNLLEDVWERWLEYNPFSLVKTYQENLKRLTGIYFDHGTSDTGTSVEQARNFDRALTEAGIPHVYEEYAGGHYDRWTSRLYVALPFLSDLLSSEMIVTAVHPQGKVAMTWASLKIDAKYRSLSRCRH